MPEYYQSQENKRQQLIAELLPWWQDEHHWNPETLKAMPLSQLLALRSRKNKH